MSKIKSPQDKKRLSLDRDRRNTYGESPHGARKSIPQRKAKQHQEERRASSQTLAQHLVTSEIEDLDKIENDIKVKTRLKRLSGFKKVPDVPLGKVIEQKKKRREIVRKPKQSNERSS